MAVVASLVACGGGGDDSSPATTAADGATPTSVASTDGSATAADDPGAVAAEPSTGCGTEADVATVSDDAPGDVARTIDVDGVERSYRLAVPEGYDPDEPAPLVLDLHGSGSDALQAGVYSDLPHAASERGVVVVAPDAVGGQWELTADGADATFLDALVDDVASRYCVDQARLHVVGMSLGAYKAALTVCGSDRWASAALVTVEIFPGGCDPLPVVAFHGTADPVAAYGEGGSQSTPDGPNPGIPGALDNMAAWAESGGCEAEPDLEDEGDDVVVRTYPGCDEGVDVVLYSIEGGGHTWPGSAITIGPPEMTTQTIDATALALDWFEDHPRRP